MIAKSKLTFGDAVASLVATSFAPTVLTVDQRRKIVETFNNPTVLETLRIALPPISEDNDDLEMGDKGDA